MVVFTCNACGDSLKKNQVEAHYLGKCRRCEVVSCVDCGKDFWGNDYQTHTKCITEEEKYSGKNYKPKANANKGEAKQEMWLQQVQDAIDKCNTNAQLKSLLERMKDYPNIPRKRAKFENFVGNSLNTRNKSLINQAWDLLMENTTVHTQNKQPEKENQQNGHTDKISQSETKKDGESTNQQAEEEECQEKKLSKRERKEERSKKANKKEKKDKSDQMENGDCEKSKKKKHSKRKREEEEENECDKVEETSTVKKRKGQKEDADDSVLDEEESPAQRGMKFDWVDIITTLLQSKGEMALKKLRKKVLAEYMSRGERTMSEEKLGAKFNKKVTKNPTFIVHKERVKLRDRK